MVNWIFLKHSVNTEKYFRNLTKKTWNQIILTIFRLIWIQTDVRLDPNQSEFGKYNLISGCFNKISKRFLCVYILSEKDFLSALNLALYQLFWNWTYFLFRFQDQKEHCQQNHVTFTATGNGTSFNHFEMTRPTVCK